MCFASLFGGVFFLMHFFLFLFHLFIYLFFCSSLDILGNSVDTVDYCEESGSGARVSAAVEVAETAQAVTAAVKRNKK